MEDIRRKVLDIIRSESLFTSLSMEPIVSVEDQTNRLSLSTDILRLLREIIKDISKYAGISLPANVFNNLSSDKKQQYNSEAKLGPPFIPIATNSISNKFSYANAVLTTPTQKQDSSLSTKTVDVTRSEKKRISPAHQPSHHPVLNNLSKLPVNKLLPIPIITTFNIDDLTKLGILYSSLIIQKFIPLNTGIPLLLTLIHLQPFMLSIKTSFIQNEIELNAFLISSIQTLSPVLLLFGNSFLSDFIQINFIKEHLPQFIESYFEIRDNDTDSEFTMHGLNNMLTDVNSDYNYVKLFDEDDSSHEYKSQLDRQAYNERQKTFDAFANIFRQYKSSNGKTDFWVQSKANCIKLLDLMPINFDWFADLFVDMLLFYGTLKNDDRDPEDNRIITSPISLESTHVPQMHDVRHRKLEERLNAGRGGSRRTSYNGSKAASDSAVEDMYARPAASFKGAEQFFFRFFLIANNGSFSRSLEMSIVSMISLFNGDEQNREVETSLANEFTTIMMKLRILGRFYGLVLFSPHWTLPLADKTSKIASQLMTQSWKKHAFLNVSLPFCNAIQSAAHCGKLCVCVSWVCESLKMIQYDIFWAEVPAYNSIFALLNQLLLFSDDLALNSFRRSSNRLMVVHEIQSLQQLLQTGTTAEFSPITFPTAPTNCFDDLNFAGACLQLQQSFNFLKNGLIPLHGISNHKQLNSSSVSPSILSSPGSNNKTKILKSKLFISPSPPLKKASTYDTALESANQIFSQLHPQPQKLCVFLLDYFQQVCVSKLRDRVAQAVRDLWTKSDELQDSHILIGTSQAEYKSALDIEIDSIILSSVTDGKSIILSLMVDGINRVLNELSKVSCVEQRVLQYSVFILKRNLIILQKQLNEFMNKFVRRKLEEVETLSISQYTKKLTDLKFTVPNDDTKYSQSSDDNKYSQSSDESPLSREDVFTAAADLISALRQFQLSFHISTIPVNEIIDETLLNIFSQSICTVLVRDDMLHANVIPESLLDRCDYLSCLVYDLIVSLYKCIVRKKINTDTEQIHLLSENTLTCCSTCLTYLRKSSECINSELKGRIKIEVAKMFLNVSVYLLLLDASLESNTRIRWLPTDIFIHAIEMDFLCLSSIARLLVPIMKAGGTAYYKTCCNLPIKTDFLKSTVKKCLRRMLISTSVEGRLYVDACDASFPPSFPRLDLIDNFPKLFTEDLVVLISTIY